MMKYPVIFLILLIIPCIWLSSCSGAGAAPPTIALTGSTPGDLPVKSLLGIDQHKQIDFIRWNLVLSNAEPTTGSFTIDINFGVGQPNTNGFIGGGEKLAFKGSYRLTRDKNEGIRGEIFELKPDNRTNIISFIKINDNLFHLLDNDNKLMVGNGGWSYTLNRKEHFPVTTSILPALKVPSVFLSDTTSKIIFEGRSPCFDSGRPDLKPSSECIKQKWLITLYRDPVTFFPTTYSIKSTMNRSALVEGPWKIKRSAENPQAIIYQLGPDKPGQSISFLAGDENVLFFLDKNGRLLTGNEDFSFALNRRPL